MEGETIVVMPAEGSRYRSLVCDGSTGQKSHLVKAALEDERAVIVRYLTSKAKAEDWHGVADAACDLREIDAKLSVLK